MVVIQVVQTTFVELIAQVIMTLRVYALSQRNRYILGALSTHVVGQFGMGLYLSAFSDHGSQSFFGSIPILFDPVFPAALELPKIPNEVFYCERAYRREVTG